MPGRAAQFTAMPVPGQPRQPARARTVAFPAISTGIFGFPRELAAQTAVATLLGLDTTVERVILVAFDEKTLRLYERLVGGPAAD